MHHDYDGLLLKADGSGDGLRKTHIVEQDRGVRPLRVGIDPLTGNNSFISRFGRAVAEAAGETVQLQPYYSHFRTYDIAILHWPALYMGEAMRRVAIKGLLRIAWARRSSGMKLVWVAHNIAQHEGPPRHRWILNRFLNELDGIIYLSAVSREIVHRAYRIPARVHELITAHGVYESEVPAAPRRQLAEADQCKLFSFGMIRRYKGYEALLNAARGLAENSETVLTLAGRKFDPTYVAEIERAATGTTIRLDLHDDHIGDDELERMIDRADGVVLPYRNILNSGAAIHALSRARPILVPNQGSMPELKAQLGSEWVQLYDGELDTADIERFAEMLRQPPRQPAPDLSAFAWPRVTEDLRRFFAKLT